MNEVLYPIEDAFREAYDKFYDRFACAGVVKEDAFDELEKAANELAKALKEVERVPKSLLNRLYQCASKLRNEAPYLEDKKEILEYMARRLELIFGLILIGESLEDRPRGNPRIR